MDRGPGRLNWPRSDGERAQADEKSFAVPPYIEDAINALIADIPAVENPTDDITSGTTK